MMTTNGHGSSGDGGSTEKPGKTGDKQKERSGRGDDRDFRARSGGQDKGGKPYLVGKVGGTEQT